MKRDIPQLCIVVPCYNEEETISTSAEVLGKVLNQMIEKGEVESSSYICFVNDGSCDKTWVWIEGFMKQSSMYRGINLSRNFGHQGALLAGLFTAEADAYISIDADLQDDVRKMPEMVRLYHDGKDVVYGCRDNRDTDTWFKRTTANMFYKLREWAGCYTIPNHADYRLMSRRAVEALKQFGEVNLFLRGIIPLLGFPSAKVFYARRSRSYGESKYPLRKMAALAWNGIVNFSEAPLMLCLLVGMLSMVMCLILALWTAWRWYIGATIPGWASIVMVITVFSSLQFLFLGVIGLYIGKVMREAKHRPVYIVQDDCTRK